MDLVFVVVVVVVYSPPVCGQRKVGVEMHQACSSFGAHLAFAWDHKRGDTAREICPKNHNIWFFLSLSLIWAARDAFWGNCSNTHAL